MKILIDIPTQMGKPHKLPLLDEELYSTDASKRGRINFLQGYVPDMFSIPRSQISNSYT